MPQPFRQGPYSPGEREVRGRFLMVWLHLMANGGRGFKGDFLAYGNTWSRVGLVRVDLRDSQFMIPQHFQ
jgi:hypothetical protein